MSSSTLSAISSGWSMVVASMAGRSHSAGVTPSPVLAMMGVSTMPGRTALTRMFSLSASPAQASVKLTTAALVAAYMGSLGMGPRAATEAVLTTAPPPRLRSARTAAPVPIITPAAFTLVTRWILSRPTSGQPGASPVMMPALLWTMSMPP